MAELLAANQITIAKVLDGEKGIQGEKGADGKSSYFHIKYSSVANPTSSSQMTETPSTYIGTYVDFTETDSTDPTKYTWSRFEGIQGEKGEQGIPGIGTDGKTSYLHIAYATSADGSEGFSISESANKTYIGQYTDFVSADSTDYTKYAWTKIKGEMSAEQLAQLNQASEDASQAKSDVANLEIGGRNLLRYTKDLPIDYSNRKGIGSFSNTGLSTTDEGLKLTFNNNSNISFKVPLAFDGAVDNGETITLSFEYRGNIEKFGEFYFLQRTSPNVNKSGFPSPIVSETEWQYYEHTFSMNNANIRTNYAVLLFYALGEYDNTHWVEIKKGSLKLEKGNKATDWTPAPEDVDTSINDVDSKIDDVTGNIYAPGSTLLDGNKISDGSLSINQMDDTVAGTYSDPTTKKGIMEWKNDALHIKSVDSNAQNTYETVVGGDGIKFNWNGVETASINQDELRINKTVVINAMEVGNWSWAIHPTTGNLMVKWNGGE